MRKIRRKRGFERAGAISVESLGLPSRRAKELRLVQAWGRAAGEPIARRTEVRVRRGVLEIGVNDGTWVELLVELAPRLASRLAGACPDLGLRSFRIRCDVSASAGVVTGAIGEPEERPPGERAATLSRPENDSAPASGDPARRLRSVMKRYLQRAGEARSRIQKP